MRHRAEDTMSGDGSHDIRHRFMMSLLCPEVATIGGGTMFGTAREALNPLGCGGSGKDVDDNEQ